MSNKKTEAVQVTAETSKVSLNDFAVSVVENQNQGIQKITPELFDLAEQVDKSELKEITTDYKTFVEGEILICIFRGIAEDKITDEETGEEKIKKVVILEDRNGKRHVNGGAVLISTFSRDYHEKLDKLFRVECTGSQKSGKGKYFTFQIFEFSK